MKQRCKEVTMEDADGRDSSPSCEWQVWRKEPPGCTPPHYTHECENKRVAKWAMRK